MDLIKQSQSTSLGVAMDKIIKATELAQTEFRKLIEGSQIAEKGLERDQYVRYLQMQYHLVKEVQKQFFEIAGHPDIFPKRKLSEFLVGFGVEEGPHYKMAERDLNDLGADLGEAPFDVKLWWSYFSEVIKTRPLVRLGGTCVLENVGSSVGDLIDAALEKSPFLTKKNTTFLILHKHEVLNHGEEILEALGQADLNRQEQEDVLQGIEDAKCLFFRMFHWVLGGKCLY